MNTLNVTLTVYELKTVLQALGHMPYVQVQELIGNLQLQATPQLQKLSEEQEAAVAKATGKDEKAA